MKHTHLYLGVVLALAASLIGGTACAQSTGASMSSPSTGSGAAGSSPVGTILPSTIQSSSTAPTQPGHTITRDRTDARSTYAPSRADAADDTHRTCVDAAGCATVPSTAQAGSPPASRPPTL